MTLNRRHLLGLMAASLAAPAIARAQGLDIRPPARPVPDPRAVVARAGLPGRVSYALIGRGGEALALRQAAVPLAPASTMKAVTALYVLDRLGPDRRFRTQVIQSGDTMVLVGGGDPVLTTDELAQLAADLASAGHPAPARFAVWGGALPGLARIAGEQAEHLPYNPSISGMMLNFNRVHLGWSRVGVDYRMEVEARAASQSPRAYTVTAAPGDHAQLFTYRQDPGRESWTVSRAAMGRAGSRWLPVRLPELYAGDVFQTLCRARGLALPAPEIIDRLPEGRVLAHHDSPAVATLLRDMLRYSTNITAEALGLHASGAADLAGSGQAMQDWLGDLGRGMRLSDHSGLTESSRIGTYAMARILDGPGRDLALAPLLRRNPLSDEPGTEARRRVAAKTGTLNFVSNLAGYVTAAGGDEGVFAIFCIDAARREGAIGQELPAGVSTWTRSAKEVQRDLLGAFAGRLA